MGWRPDLQDEMRNAEKSETGRHGCWQHQEAHLEILPAEDRERSHRTVPALGEGSPFRSVLVVPVPHANKGTPIQGVRGVTAATEDSVGGSTERDGEVEEPVEDPRSFRRSEVQSGGAGFSLTDGRGEDRAGCGSGVRGGV